MGHRRGYSCPFYFARRYALILASICASVNLSVPLRHDSSPMIFSTSSIFGAIRGLFLFLSGAFVIITLPVYPLPRFKEFRSTAAAAF